MKVAATVDPAIMARAVPRLRFTDRLIKSPDRNPNGTRSKDVNRTEREPGITKYMNWLIANQEIEPSKVKLIAAAIDLI